jgi:hypothetical protein
MAITVFRESDNTKSIFVTPTYIDKDGNQLVAGSEKPFAVADVNHVRLHEGRAFYVYANKPHGNLLANDANLDIAIAFGAGKTPHLVFSMDSGGDGEFTMYEGATVSGGTAFTAINRFRPSSNVSLSAALVQPTVTATGTQLAYNFLAGGSGKKASGAEAFSFQYVLNPLTTYLFRFTNRSGSAQISFIMIDWYE